MTPGAPTASKTTAGEVDSNGEPAAGSTVRCAPTVDANSRRFAEKSDATIVSTPRAFSAAMIAMPIGPHPIDQRRLTPVDGRLVDRVQADRHRFGERGAPGVEPVGHRQQQRRGQQHPFGVTTERAVAVDDHLHARLRQQHRYRRDEGARRRRLGVRPCVDDLGAEFVAHEHVGSEVHRHTRSGGQTLQLRAGREHVVPVLGEVQIRPADAARLDADQDLAWPGNGLGQIVAIDHPPAAQHRAAHQLPAFCSSTCSVIALTIAWPARPNS